MREETTEEEIINFQETPQDQINWGWRLYYKWRKFLNKFRNW